MILIVTFCYNSSYAQKRTAKAEILLTEETFFIRNVASGKCLDVSGRNTKNGTKVHLWDYVSGQNQKFKFQQVEDRYYYILPQHTNSRLDVKGCFPRKIFCKYYKNKNGAPIQIWKFYGESTHDVGKWELRQVNTGQFVLINKFSNKVLDADTHKLKRNGCKVQIWSRNNRENQLWEFISVETGQRYESHTINSK